MVVKATVDSSNARKKLQQAQARIGVIQEAVLRDIGLRMERGMKLQVSSGPNKAVKTGKMKSNLQFQLLGSGLGSVVVVGADRSVDYAKWVALGTKTKGGKVKMKKRPYHLDAWIGFVRPRLDEIAIKAVSENTADLR